MQKPSLKMYTVYYQCFSKKMKSKVYAEDQVKAYAEAMKNIKILLVKEESEVDLDKIMRDIIGPEWDNLK